MIIEFIDLFFPLGEFDIITLTVGIAISTVLMLWSKRTGSDQLRNYAPTLWTSLGIFFTFVSIFTSLSGYAASNMDNGIANAGHSSFIIRDMIGKIIPAFSTSIIGILGAVITTLINKISIANAERKENIKFQKLRKQKVGDNKESDTPDLMLLEIVSSIKESGINTCSRLDQNHSNSDKKINDIYKNILSLGFDKTNETVVTQQQELLKSINLFLEKYISTNKEQQETITSKFDDLQKMLADKIDYLITRNSDTILKLIDVHKDNIKLIADNLIKESHERNIELRTFIEKEESLIEGFISKADNVFDLRIKQESELFNNEIKNTIESFAKSQHELCASTISNCNEVLVKESLKAIERQTEESQSFIADLQSKLSSTCQSITSSVNDMSIQMSIKLDEILEKEISIIDKTVEHNKEEVSRILEAYNGTMSSVANEIATSANTLIERNIEFEKSSRETLNSQKQMNKEFLENCENSLSQLSVLVNSSLSKLSITLINKLDEIQQQETLLIESTIKGNTYDIGLLLNANRDSIERIANEIKDDNDGLKIYLADFQKWLKESAIEIETNHLKDVIQIKHEAEEKLSQLQSTILDIHQSLDSTLESIKENIIDSTKTFIKDQNEIKKHIIDNAKSLSDDITKKIHDSSRIKDLEDASIKLTSSIRNCMEDLKNKMQIITTKLDETSQHINESATKYDDTLERADAINRYIESTKELFQNHTTSITILESSLSNIEASIKRVVEQFIRTNNRNNERQEKNPKNPKKS